MITQRRLKQIFALALLLLLLAIAYLPRLTTSSELQTDTVQENMHVNENALKSSPHVVAENNSPSTALDHSARDEKFDLWLEHIKTSSASVDQTAKAIYEKDAAKNLALLKILLATDPQNSLLNYLLIQACLIEFDPNLCLPVSKSALQMFESDNGAVRDLEVLDLYHQGDTVRALAILNEANHSPYSNDFTDAKFSALAQSMEQFGFKRDLAMIVRTEGVLASGLANHLNSLLLICTDNQTNSAWKEACYARGKALVERGRDSYSKIMGMQLMKNFGNASDPIYAKVRNQFNAALSAANREGLRWETMIASGWAPSDLQWEEFLTLYKTQGGSAAKAYLESLMPRD